MESEAEGTQREGEGGVWRPADMGWQGVWGSGSLLLMVRSLPDFILVGHVHQQAQNIVHSPDLEGKAMSPSFFICKIGRLMPTPLTFAPQVMDEGTGDRRSCP